MAEEQVTTQEPALLVKAVMLEYVVPCLLGLLGYLGTQLLDKVETLEDKDSKQGQQIVALQRDLDHMTKEVTRLRNKE